MTDALPPPRVDAELVGDLGDGEPWIVVDVVRLDV
jgi:hypothetical protein